MRCGSGTLELFSLPFSDLSYAGAVQELQEVALGAHGQCKVVVTPNVDHVVRIHRDSKLLKIYQGADYFFPDGAPIVWVGKASGLAFKERVTGADLFVSLCTELAKRLGRVFVLGGKPGDDSRIKESLERTFTGLVVDVFSPSMNFTPTGPEADEAIRRIRLARPNIVFACIGLPKQERWALECRERIASNLVLCVGAALDFALGRARRAPILLQRAGLEWFWRLLNNPRHLWRRYLVDDLGFLPLALDEVINGRRRRRENSHLQQGGRG